MIAQRIKNLSQEIAQQFPEHFYTLIAVSKYQPIIAIEEAYLAGHRDFGENYVQELCEKQAQLPQDIQWHYIGALQSNKVKYIAPFVHLIHTLDRISLCDEIQKQGQKHQRILSCLIQIAISPEETKLGGCTFSEAEALYAHSLTCPYVNVVGFMGMASFTTDETVIQQEFRQLASFAQHYPQCKVLSMGMSGDYPLALTEGSTMIRIGTKIFGARS